MRWPSPFGIEWSVATPGTERKGGKGTSDKPIRLKTWRCAAILDPDHMDSSSRSQPGRSAPNAAPRREAASREASGLRGLIRRTSAFYARRRLAVGIVLAALAMTDLIITIACPSTYRATATVLVESPRLPEDVKPLVPSVQDRLGQLKGLALSDEELGQLAADCPRLARPPILHIFEGGASSTNQKH